MEEYWEEETYEEIVGGGAVLGCLSVGTQDLPLRVVRRVLTVGPARTRSCLW